MKKLKTFILLIMTSFWGFAQNCDVTIEVDETPMGIILTANGTGSGTYEFIWDNNQTGNSIVVTPNGTIGTYCVDMITSDSCFATACASIIGGNDCSVDISQNPNTPILTANATGTAPFAYSWSDGTVGQTTQISFLIQEYCVTVTDADGCVAEDCFNTGSGNDCNVNIVLNPSGALFASGTGTGNISYLWSTGDMTSTIFPSSTGDYCVTTTDSDGCTANDCYFYSVDTMGCEVTIIVDSLNTGGNGFILTANATGDGPFNYFWDNNETTQSIEVVADGTYCVTIEGPNNCLATACVTVGGNANCAVVISESFFGGLIANGSGMGSYSFVWSTGETTQNIFPLTSGEYCVTATAVNGCFATDCYFYDNGGGQDSCFVDISVVQNGAWLQAIANGVAPFTYNWNTGETVAAIAIVPNINTYCVDMTDATGCVSSNCITVGGDDCNVFVDLTAFGGLGAFSNSFGPFTYQWNTGENTQFITPASTGDYCVTLTDATGCEASDCYFYTMDSLCTATMIATPIMGSTALELSVNASGVAPFTYNWSTNETTSTIIITQSGTYCVTVVDADGCEAGSCSSFSIQTPNFNINGFVHPADSLNGNVALEGWAYLYLMDINAVPILVDSVELLSTPIGGTIYDFGAVAAGDYIVKVALNPNTPQSTVSLPTYHWSTEVWQGADVISIPFLGQSGYDVHMIYGDNPDGDGQISGGVFVFDGLPNTPFDPDSKPGDNPTKNLGDPISNISILLFNEFEEPAGHTVTDGAGEFSFPNLAWGTYKVWVEITGKEQAFYWVTIGPDNPTATGLFFEVDNGQVTTDLQEIIAEEGIKVFPNPATTSVNILLNVKQNSTLQLMLTSVTGQTLQSNNQEVTKGQQLINLNIDNIPSGIYFLNISDGKEVISRRLVISK